MCDSDAPVLNLWAAVDGLPRKSLDSSVRHNKCRITAIVPKFAGPVTSRSGMPGAVMGSGGDSAGVGLEVDMPNLSSDADSEAKSAGTRSPRQIVEVVMELLRQEDCSATSVDNLFDELAFALDRRFSSQEFVFSFENAVERAPWLTADAERLKQQQAELQQSLQAIRMLPCYGGSTVESARQLALRINDFAELFSEYEADEDNFLHAAFPGPHWAMDR